eukprot:TRINITY_DN3429_c0_g2_i1.p1 TRINITY_DN3429_c0_g2~~TRINITY_DN3429_c0_g2_i1.p1  ORF type:complete len:1521 (+),score=322.13 TRINITY_DN3429_c0_g2_i1:327-4889(+)
MTATAAAIAAGSAMEIAVCADAVSLVHLERNVRHISLLELASQCNWSIRRWLTSSAGASANSAPWARELYGSAAGPGAGSGGGTTAGGGGGGGTSGKSGGSRFHSPPVELPSSNAQNFFEEAKITQAEENELRRKFGKFCTRVPAAEEGGEEEAFLTLEGFCCLLQHYDCASAQNFEAYFYAIDRNRDDRLDFQEFFLGCCAADPSTVHILNSYTGQERSHFIFDYYDTNRSTTLEFEEFARLTADCLSLQTTDPKNEQVRNTAVEKARDLGTMVESSPGNITFSCIKFEKFYEFIQSERLRGTSRLFRFFKSIIKSRSGHHGRRAHGSSVASSGGRASGEHGSSHGGSGHGGSHGYASPAPTTSTRSPGSGAGHDDVTEDLPSDYENCSWHAHLLQVDGHFDRTDADADEVLGPPAVTAAAVEPRSRGPPPQPYVSISPPVLAPNVRLEPDPTSATDARSIARKVLRGLAAPRFEGLMPAQSTTADEAAPFTLATPAQLRSLCSAAVRLLEAEDMVLTGLMPPVKVFGALHGQLADLLSYFKWHQLPVEEGDILYTTYVFLGDYADRGGDGLEVLALLLSLKVVHPHRVALLRGHHESRHANYHFGLRAECERRLGAAEGPKVYEHLNRVFEHMSLAAVIGQQVLALGPGVLAPSLSRLDQLRKYQKPLVLPHVAQPRSAGGAERLAEQVLLELFTPGPFLSSAEHGSLVSREPSLDHVNNFCAQHRLAAVVLSRKIPRRGFSISCGGRLVNLTSCLDYCDLPGGNDAAILCITKEEGSQSLHIRPKVLTAQVARTYQFVGRASPTLAAPLRPPRWPVQERDPTPGRVEPASSSADAFGSSAVAGVGEGNDEADASSADPTALVVRQDRTVLPLAASEAPVEAFVAFGPGRPPGGAVPRDRAGGSALGGGDGAGHMRSAGYGGNGEISREDWVLMGGGSSGGMRTGSSGGTSLGERRSLGSRRSSGSGAANAAGTAGGTGAGALSAASAEAGRSRGNPGGSKSFVDPIVTTLFRASDDPDAPANATPKCVSPERRSLPRAPAGGSAGAAGAASKGGGGGLPTAPGAGGAGTPTENLPAHRRGASSAGGDGGPRLSLGGAAAAAATPSTTASPAGSTAGDRRDSKNSTPGVATPTGGRSTPASGGVLVGGGGQREAERRSAGGGGGGGNWKASPKEATAMRGPSRPPGGPAAGGGSPKSAGGGASAGGAGAQRNAARRGAGEAAGGGTPLGSQGCAGAGGGGGASMNAAAVAGDDGGGLFDDATTAPTEPQALARLLQTSAAPWLSATALPPAPTAFLQHLQQQPPRAFSAEQALVVYLCRLWLDAGLNDKEWSSAVAMFGSELYDQPRQSMGRTSSSGGHGDDPESRETRWTLETFSMWFLRRGRRLRECTQWFRAFDFDQDEMICIADFLQGLAAASAVTSSARGGSLARTSATLCRALALYRLLDLEKRPSLDPRELEALLVDAPEQGGSQAPVVAPGELTQLVQRAADFDYFRQSLLPRLTGASSRLRVFGASSEV